MILTITFDPTSRLGVGTGRYVGLTPKLAIGEVVCTAAQAGAPGQWKLAADGKTIVAASAADLAPTAAQLTAYAKAHAKALRNGGIKVNVGTAATPVDIDVATDAEGHTRVNGMVQMIGLAAQAGQAAPTFDWSNKGGAQITLTAAQIQSVALTLNTFIQATFKAFGAIEAAIAAGTIATSAQIAAAAWPSTSY